METTKTKIDPHAKRNGALMFDAIDAARMMCTERLSPAWPLPAREHCADDGSIVTLRWPSTISPDRMDERRFAYSITREGYAFSEVTPDDDPWRFLDLEVGDLERSRTMDELRAQVGRLARRFSAGPGADDGEIGSMLRAIEVAMANVRAEPLDPKTDTKIGTVELAGNDERVTVAADENGFVLVRDDVSTLTPRQARKVAALLLRAADHVEDRESE